MKLKIEKQILENAIKAVSAFANKKDNSNVVSCIKFEVSGYDIILSATDYEFGITKTVSNLGNLEDGLFLINASSFVSTISRLKSGEVEILKDGNKITIKQKRSKTVLETFDDEFPQIPNKKDNMGNLTLDYIHFNNAIKAVLSGVDVGNPKIELGGALFDISKDNINIVSTDTKCLIINEFNTSSEIESNIIVPKKAIIEIQKNITSESVIYFDDVNIILENDGTIIFSRLINGKFPDYKRVIPKESKYKIILNSSEFLESIKCVTGVSESITMTISNNTICLKTEDDRNKSEDYIDIKSDIDNFEISFNSKFFVNFLSVINGEFEMSLNDSNLPILLTCEDLKSIIMPQLSN